jgi:hypothetical protein
MSPSSHSLRFTTCSMKGGWHNYKVSLSCLIMLLYFCIRHGANKHGYAPRNSRARGRYGNDTGGASLVSLVVGLQVSGGRGF